MQKDTLIIAFFVLALAGFILSDVRDTPSGMVVKNISAVPYDESPEPELSPDTMARFNEQAILCNKYLSEQDDNNSIACLVEADAIKEDIQVILALAELQMLAGNDAESEKYYSRALVIEPGNQNARYNHAVVLERLGRLNETLVEYAHLVQLNPGHAGALNNMGVIFQRLGELNKSADAFRRAVIFEPNSSATILNYANVLAELGQNSMAEENYRKSIELDPNNKGAYRNFAQFLYNNGRYIEAKDMLEKSY